MLGFLKSKLPISSNLLPDCNSITRESHGQISPFIYPNAIYFFTVVLHDRRSDWLIKYIEQLKNAIRRVKILYPFKTKAIDVLPDHLHVMWQLPENDANYSLRWRLIKIQFTNNLRLIGINVL